MNPRMDSGGGFMMAEGCMSEAIHFPVGVGD